MFVIVCCCRLCRLKLAVHLTSAMPAEANIAGIF